MTDLWDQGPTAPWYAASLGATMLLCVLAVALASWKYRTLLHPLLLPAASLAVMAGLAPAAQWALGGLEQPTACLFEASLLTNVWLLSVAAPILSPLDPLRPVVGRLLRPAEVAIRPTAVSRAAAWLAIAGLLAAAGATFGMLVRDSAAGVQWVTQPRLAYMHGRSGVGHWYVASQTFLLLALLAALHFLRPRRVVTLAGIVLPCAAMFLWYGSKAGVVGVLLSAAVYVHYQVRPLGPAVVLPVLAASLPLVVASPWLQGNFDSLRESMAYYDYFNNTAMYLGEADRIGAHWGGAWLSGLWEFVPRRLVPDKPYDYGILAINEYFWPGSAEQGHTPALLPWTGWHLDFRWPGVVLGGLTQGFVQKAVYTDFVRRRTWAGWLLCLQFCFLPVMKHAPWPYFAVLLVACAAALRGTRELLGTVGRPPPRAV